MRFRLLWVAAIVFALFLGGIGCEKKRKQVQQASAEEQGTPSTPPVESPPQSPAKQKASPATPPQRRVAVSAQPPPTELWREFSGRRALENAGNLVALGPRRAGSQALDSARRIFVTELESAAWEVESDAFESPSPNGVVRGVNLIARFSAEGFRPVPTTPRAVLIVAPYDTRAFSTIHFVGANDGASGPAMLLELARVFSLNPKLAERVELLFADASEPRQQFSPTDGLAGSRHYVARVDSKSLRRVLVLGGVGANGEALTVPPDTPAEVWQEATQCCARIGKPALLRKLDRFMWGDHVPFAERGISSLYLGNHDYLARYTTDDRIEKLSATTFEQGGQFATWLVSHWAQP